MAYPEQELESLDFLLDCDVCLETFTNPRTLSCGHEFCEECLRGVARRHPQGHVTCPTCRVVTKVTGDVTNLPRSVRVAKIQEKVIRLPRNDPAVRKCEEIACQTPATKRCMTCVTNVCDPCMAIHIEAGHTKYLTITTELFCRQHTKYVITKYCVSCEELICDFCCIKEHRGHSTEAIEDTAKTVRQELQQIMDGQRDDTEYRQVQAQATSTMNKMTKEEEDFHDKMKELTTTLQQAISKESNNYQGKLKTHREKLEKTLADFKDLNTSRQELADFIHRLLDTASDPELVGKGKEVPQRVPTGKFELCDNTPSSRDHMKNIVDACKLCITKVNSWLGIGTADIATSTSDLQPTTADVFTDTTDLVPASVDITTTTTDLVPASVDVTTTTTDIVPASVDVTTTATTTTTDLVHVPTLLGKACNIPDRDPTVRDDRPTIDMDHVTEVARLDMYVNGMVFNTQEKKLLVLKDHRQVDVYDYNGVFVSTLLKADTTIKDTQLRSMAIDTKRNLYLISSMTGLVLLQQNGRVKGTMRTVGDIRGVTYVSKDDVYVVTDVVNHEVCVYNPNTKQRVTKFGGKGLTDDKFDFPIRITSYYDSGRGYSVLVITDCNNCCIKLFTVQGEHLQTIGSRGHELGQLWNPLGVHVDTDGGMLVCDTDNNRVVRHCKDGVHDTWTCLVDKGILRDDNSPFYISYDPDCRLLAIATYKDGVISLTDGKILLLKLV